jgi:lipopolysaccharide/colanic/teichoic acid biosynthesis glycosyltransferase
MISRVAKMPSLKPHPRSPWDRQSNSTPVDFSDIDPDVRVPVWKRVLDLACILVASPVIILVMLLIAVGIKILSPGKIFFRQERVGFRGRRFTVYKFRSMHEGVDTSMHQSHLKALIQSDAPMVKLDTHGDERLLPLGWLFRASGLDELPQVINILRGEMSLVGPRPCTPYEFAQYEPWHKQRVLTLPGLTGLWQVSGKNRTTFTQMVHLDLEYIRRQSLGLDLRIMLKTFSALADQIRGTRTSVEEPMVVLAPYRTGEMRSPYLLNRHQLAEK